MGYRSGRFFFYRQQQEAYNGLQQLITQYQSVSGSVNTSTTPSVQYNYNVMGDGQNNSKLRSIAYPNGRIVDYDYSSNQEPVTSISVSGTTATVTTAAAHGLSTGATVTMAGASHAALDGTFTITVTNSTHFTYTFTGSASTDSSSDITETPVSLDSTISRPDGLQDHAGSAAGTVLQSDLYLGLGTIVQENDGNGTELTYIAPATPTPTPTPSAPPTTIDSAGDRYTGLDRFGRVVFQNWYNTSTGAQTQGDQYGYDNNGDVLFDNVVNQGTTAASYSQLYHASTKRFFVYFSLIMIGYGPAAFGVMDMTSRRSPSQGMWHSCLLTESTKGMRSSCRANVLRCTINVFGVR